MLTQASNLVAVILQHSVNAHTVRVFRSSYLVILKAFFHIPCTILTICLYSNTQIGRLSFMSYSHLQYKLCILCTSPWKEIFPDLLFYQILLLLNLTEYVNYLVIDSQKSTFLKIKAGFSYNLALNIMIKPLLKLS